MSASVELIILKRRVSSL